MKLGLINSAWLGTSIDTRRGIELTKEIGFDTIDIFADRTGDWRVVILGSQANDRWEMKITGPNGFERSYTLEGTLGQHEPPTVVAIIARMLPTKT